MSVVMTTHPPIAFVTHALLATAFVRIPAFTTRNSLQQPLLIRAMSTSSTHWNVVSAWSKAGIGTNIVLELKQPQQPHNQKCNNVQTSKRQKSMPLVAFDIGATPCFDDAIPAKFVFVSHGHVDHIGGLFSHARAHSVAFGGAAPTYFVPEELLPHLEQCREAMSLLDSANYATTTVGSTLESNPSHENKDESGRRESLMNMNLVPVKPGDEFPLQGIHSGSKTSFFIRAFRADHANHPALGYLLCSRTSSSGLKPEYQHLDNDSIRDLAKSGVKIQNDPVEKVEVAYTGDTCADGLIVPDAMNINIPAGVSEDGVTMPKQKSDEYIRQIFRAELIFCELTFLDYEEKTCNRKMAKDRGHLHICELDRIFSHNAALDCSKAIQRCVVDESTTSVDMTEEFGQGRAQSIIFFHLSGRYGPAKYALDMISAGIPHYLKNKCLVAICSMLSKEEKMQEDSFVQFIRPNGCISISDYLDWKNKCDSLVGDDNFI